MPLPSPLRPIPHPPNSRQSVPTLAIPPGLPYNAQHIPIPAIPIPNPSEMGLERLILNRKPPPIALVPV